MQKFKTSLLLYCLILLNQACVTESVDSQDIAKAPKAVANMIDKNSKAIGTIQLEETKTGVLLKIDLKGLTPGAHGIHFHEAGSCIAPDFKSAGGHFNPLGKHHGLDNPEGSHAGDLPNLFVDKHGVAKTILETTSVTLHPSAVSLVKSGGVSIIIHKDIDDQKSDPSGNSGDRVACGIVSIHPDAP
jgi:Cu-Zn family superoxide dismutase